jgi:hypothetical protein
MQKYVNQLIQDIEHVIRSRWHKNPPHFYKMGIPDPYLIEPENIEYKPDNKASFAVQMNEVEMYKHGDKTHNMFYHFGFSFEQFPPVSILNKGQTDALTSVILRMWATFNYKAAFPNNTPSEMLYPILCKQMEIPKMLLNQGVIGIEFCEYEPRTCIFGTFCSCEEIEI